MLYQAKLCLKDEKCSGGELDNRRLTAVLWFCWNLIHCLAIVLFISTVMKIKRKNYEKLQWLQKRDAEYKSRRFYKQLNGMRDGLQAKLLSCRSAASDVLSDRADILNGWNIFKICMCKAG
jgi:hypothetical protein